MRNKLLILNDLFTIIRNKKKLLPEKSYTADLFKQGKEKIANKVGEEAVETITAFLLEKKKCNCRRISRLNLPLVCAT